MTFWLLLKHEPTVQLVLWMKLNWMWCMNVWRAAVMLLPPTKSMTMTAQRSKRVYEQHWALSTQAKITEYAGFCLHVSLFRGIHKYASIFHKWKDFQVYFQRTLHVCVAVYAFPVLHVRTDKSIFFLNTSMWLRTQTQTQTQKQKQKRTKKQKKIELDGLVLKLNCGTVLQCGYTFNMCE